MSMEINHSCGNYKTNYPERLQQEPEKAKEMKETREIKETRETKETKETRETEKTREVLQDEYISSEKSGIRHSGLYRLGQDENGNPKVIFDAPKKSESANGTDVPKNDMEKCTADTGKVDQEIEKLKEQEKQLEQQIKSASGDEKKVKELEQKLLRIRNELSRKDNDTYRRLHASVF